MPQQIIFHLRCVMCCCCMMTSACETSEELSRSYPGETLDVAGDWLSDCYLADENNDNAYAIDYYQIADDKSYQLARDYFASDDCGDAVQQSFTYNGFLSEGAKVVANDGALAVFVSDTLRNVQWPESIGSLYLQRIVRVQDDQLYWGQFAQNRNSSIDYSVTYTKQP